MVRILHQFFNQKHTRIHIYSRIQCDKERIALSLNPHPDHFNSYTPRSTCSVHPQQVLRRTMRGDCYYEAPNTTTGDLLNANYYNAHRYLEVIDLLVLDTVWAMTKNQNKICVFQVYESEECFGNTNYNFLKTLCGMKNNFAHTIFIKSEFGPLYFKVFKLNKIKQMKQKT